MEKVVLVAGHAACGKTCLIRRCLSGAFAYDALPTVSLAEVGTMFIDGSEDLLPELSLLLPSDGVTVRFWEMGGKGNRCLPRGKSVHGLLLCYEAHDRASLQSAARFCRLEPFMECADVPRVPVVLCGTKSDLAEAGGVDARAQAFSQTHHLHGLCCTSSVTGEGVSEAVQTLIAAILQHEEEAEARHMLQGIRGPPGPRHEVDASVSRGEEIVELISGDVGAYGARPLRICLDRKLLHRAVHIWVVDARTGGVMLRKYSDVAPKHPGRWGPTAHGEILCGRHVESSPVAALRALREQTGLERQARELQFWLSCTSEDGRCHELLDVYVTLHRGSSPLELPEDEQIEWVHFLDIFNSTHVDLFHMDPCYAATMASKMRSAILHASSYG